MALYSISYLEKLSGVRAHTIRVWEQRYNLLTPHRSEGNTRYYDDDEMRKLLNISTLVNAGEKISRLSRLSDEELNRLIDKVLIEKSQDTSALNTAIINRLISAGASYDEQNFDKAFSSAVLKYGLADAYEKIIYPMLVKIGQMWGTCDLVPAQEHFISNLLKQKLYSAIEQTSVGAKPKETWLLFLPEEENHELGLLMSSFLLHSAGRRVIYLGSRVPYQNLKAVVEQVKPDYLNYFLVTHTPAESVQQRINTMSKDFKGIKQCICGPEHLRNKIHLPKHCTWVSSLQGLSKILTKKA